MKHELELFKKVLQQFNTQLVNGSIVPTLKPGISVLDIFLMIKEGLEEIERKKKNA